MTSNTLNLGGADFVFNFSFSPDEPLLSPPSSPPSSEQPILSPKKPYVECLFYRRDYPNDYFHWAGTLKASVPIPFELPGSSGTAPIASYPDNDNCKGSFWLYTNTYTGESFVWVDINYGPDYQGEFEGTIVQIVSDKNQ
jgi:hypothetical protein